MALYLPGRPFPEMAAPLASPDLSALEWVRATFIAEDGPLYNPDHKHLRHARLGLVWMEWELVKAGRRIIGQAQQPAPPSTWSAVRGWSQLVAWFGEVPDFVLSFDAETVREQADAEWCALVEHELYHCGQLKRHGVPVLDRKSGRPKFTIRGHDVEEHVGVVRRYGAGASSCGVSELVAAGNLEPEVAPVRISIACGTCLG